VSSAPAAGAVLLEVAAADLGKTLYATKLEPPEPRCGSVATCSARRQIVDGRTDALGRDVVAAVSLLPRSASRTARGPSVRARDATIAGAARPSSLAGSRLGHRGCGPPEPSVAFGTVVPNQFREVPRRRSGRRARRTRHQGSALTVRGRRPPRGTTCACGSAGSRAERPFRRTS